MWIGTNMCQHVITTHLFGTSRSQPPTGWPSSFRCHFPCSRSSKLLPCLGRLKAGILEPGNPGSCPVLLDGSSSVHGCASTSSGVSMLRSPHPSQHCDGWAPIKDGGSTAEISGSKGMFFFGKGEVGCWTHLWITSLSRMAVWNQAGCW